MKKKKYVKPTVKVVVLRQRPQLLVGSVTATRTSYGSPTEDTWE